MSNNDSTSSAFITEVDASRKQNQLRPRLYHDVELMDQCRKDYSKIKDVVKTFSLKVETLIDKQRHEYIQAYESHMSDVQKELHQLREKVAEIANDETKNENIASLKKEQSAFKSEALRLLGDSDDSRRKIRSLVRETYALERTRDWMLEKLRQAKKEYNFLLKERTRVFEDLEVELDSQSLSQASLGESSYTIELQQRPIKVKGGNGTLRPIQQPDDWDKKLAVLTVSRGSGVNTHPILGFQATRNETEPLIGLNRSPSNMEGRKPYPDPISLITEQITLPVAASEINSGNIPPGIGLNRGPPPGLHSKSQLVSARARRSELREFLSFCATSLHRPPWCRVQKRPYNKLLNDCMQQLREVPPRHFSSNKLVLQLACELAAYPQTYAAILLILEGLGPTTVNNGNHARAGNLTVAALGSSQGKNSQDDEGDEDGEDEGGAAGEEQTPGGANELAYTFTRRSLGGGLGVGDSSPGLGLRTRNLLYADLEATLLRPPTTPKQTQELMEFKEKINNLLSSNTVDSAFSYHDGNEDGSETLLDEDLRLYLEQEKNNRTLKKMGYFNKEQFLKFN